MGIAIKCAAVGLGLVAAAAIAEAALRIAPRPGSPAELAIYRPHHHISYVIAPRAPSMQARGPHNSLGFRGPDVLREKRPGFARIACVGGSTTYGTTQVDERECWPRKLESALRAKRPRLEVLNCGIPAHNSADSMQLLRERVMPLAPDVVVLYMGYNDVMPRFVPNFRPDYTHYRSTWIHPDDPALRPSIEILDRLQRLLRRPAFPLVLRQLTTHPYDENQTLEEKSFAASSPQTFERNIRTMVDALLGAGIQPVLATQSYFEARLEPDFGYRAHFFRNGMRQHAEAMRNVAMERKVLLVDLERAIRTADAFDDPVHHNSVGTQQVARQIAEAIDRRGLLGPRKPPK
jgi:lysophospholipase L1-like esterase